MHHSELVQIIKNRRESLCITQQMLADLADLSLRTVKQFESGTGNPTLKTLNKIAGVLGLETYLRLKHTTTDK